jgi:flagellar motor protein MotB
MAATEVLAMPSQLLYADALSYFGTFLLQDEPGHILAVGCGSSRPIASNDTPEGRSQNSRVEVVNLGRTP